MLTVETKGMRRGRLFLIVALGLASVAPSVQAGPVEQQRLAFADWKGKQFDRNHWEWFGAVIFEDATVGGRSEIFGGVFKGRCAREKKKDGVHVSCHGSGEGMSKNDTFTMGPAASSAVLDVKDDEFHHHVDWAAKNDETPGFFQSESGCPAGQGHGGGIVRDAIATADIFGRHFESKSGFSWNMLWEGAHVTQCSPFSLRDIGDVLDGGAFTLHRTWTIPPRSPRLAI